MSGGGALQQRTTYLISLTLVKVEAVEENGGEARSSSQGKEVEAWPAGGAGPRVEPAGGDTHTENGAGPELKTPSRAEDAAAARRSELTDAVKDGDRNQPPSSDGIPVLGTERGPAAPPPAEKTTGQRTEVDLSRAERTPCTTPQLTTGTPTEPSRTPTRTSLPMRPVGQRPVSLLKSHSSMASRGRESREGRERSPTSAQSLDRKDCRVPACSPGPCRASWAEASRSEGWKDADDALPGTALEVGGGMAAVMRDVPRKERLKTGSASLPAPASQTSKPARKGKSRTLDNSDLNSLSEDLGLTRDPQQAPQGQRASAKDRKMLKFISGIFTKSSSGTVGSTAPPVYIQRDSSEEEGRGL